MGEVVELTTSLNQNSVFYKITTHCLTFEVKALGHVAIGLSIKPYYTCNFWITIGEGKSSIIRVSDNDSQSVVTSNIVSKEEFRKFWITWNGDCIRFGKDGETKCTLSYVSNTAKKLYYVTLANIGNEQSAFWRVYLPPLKRPISYRPIKSGKPEWISTLIIPDGAVIGGYENQPLYIVRAHHMGSLTPGKFVPLEGVAYIPWGGVAHEKNEFSVLCGLDFLWTWTYGSEIPAGALAGGYSEDRNEVLYIGRAEHNGHLIPGKVQPSHRVCYIPFEGREIAKTKYQILIQPELKMNSAHTMSIHSLQHTGYIGV